MTFEQHHYDKRWVNVELRMPLAYELVATMTPGGQVDYDWLEPVDEILYFAENHGPVQYWMNIEDFHRYAPSETIEHMRHIAADTERRRVNDFEKFHKVKPPKTKTKSKVKRIQHGQVDPTFAYIDMTEEQYIELWRSYYPAGSGPLSVMKTACALIESIAKLRGFDPSTWTR